MLNSQKMESQWLKVKTLKTRNRVESIDKNILSSLKSLLVSKRSAELENLIPSAKTESWDLTGPCISSLNMHLLGIYDFCTLKWDNFLPICQLGKLSQMHGIFTCVPECGKMADLTLSTIFIFRLAQFKDGYG